MRRSPATTRAATALAVVLDAFCGSGVFVAEAVGLGRVGIGIDSDARWIARTDERCRAAVAVPGNVLPFRRPAPPRPQPTAPAQLALFGAPA